MPVMPKNKDTKFLESLFEVLTKTIWIIAVDIIKNNKITQYKLVLKRKGPYCWKININPKAISEKNNNLIRNDLIKAGILFFNKILNKIING